MYDVRLLFAPVIPVRQSLILLWCCALIGCSGNDKVGGFHSCPSHDSTRLVSGGLTGPSSPPSGCQKPVHASTLPAAQVQSFGTHRVGEVIHFAVPPSTGTMSIVSQAVSAIDEINYQGQLISNTVVPTLLTAPDGGVLYDDNVQPPNDPSGTLAFYGADSPTTGAFTLPNTTPMLTAVQEGGGFAPGSWSFTVNDFALECITTAGCDGGTASSTYDVSVLTKPGQTPSAVTIDVAFYLVGAGGVTSASAPGDSHVKRMVQTLGTLFDNAGICLGTVTFWDIPSWAQTQYANSIDLDRTGPCDNLSQMSTLARDENTLNFFLVGSISATLEGGTVVGIDGAIPGPSSIGGTVHSGAAVSAADLSSGSCSGSLNLGACGADVVGYVAAHEGGHWLGLYHTSENDGESFDPIADTPTCVCDTCVLPSRRANCATPGRPPPANPTMVGPSDCSQGTTTCGGADNLMFWRFEASNRSQGNLTAQQGQVMRANPVAR